MDSHSYLTGKFDQIEAALARNDADAIERVIDSIDGDGYPNTAKTIAAGLSQTSVGHLLDDDEQPLPRVTIGVTRPGDDEQPLPRVTIGVTRPGAEVTARVEDNLLITGPAMSGGTSLLEAVTAALAGRATLWVADLTGGRLTATAGRHASWTATSTTERTAMLNGADAIVQTRCADNGPHRRYTPLVLVLDLPFLNCDDPRLLRVLRHGAGCAVHVAVYVRSRQATPGFTSLFGSRVSLRPRDGMDAIAVLRGLGHDMVAEMTSRATLDTLNQPGSGLFAGPAGGCVAFVAVPHELRAAAPELPPLELDQTSKQAAGIHDTTASDTDTSEED